jgi:hypothetical protein
VQVSVWQLWFKKKNQSRSYLNHLVANQRPVLKIWDRANRPEKVETEEEVDADEKGPYILHTEV